MKNHQNKYGNFGLSLLIIAALLLVFYFHYKVPKKEALERHEATYFDSEVVHVQRGNSHRVEKLYIYVKSKKGKVVWCNPTFFKEQYFSVSPGAEIWALGEKRDDPVHGCSFYPWEVGVGDRVLISYEEHVNYQMKLRSKVPTISLNLVIIGCFFIYYQRNKSNKRES